MTSHSSATMREAAPHENETRTNNILNALKRRAQARLSDKSIAPQNRAILRYALETHDPWLAELVRRADAGETLVDRFDCDDTSEPNNDVSREEKIEALTETICRAGDEPGIKAAALLVLMATIESAQYAKALANIVKHLAFIRCGELNLYDMVDTQIAVAESELFADKTNLS